MDMNNRPRRLRVNETMRRMVRETKVSKDDLVYPVFLVEGQGVKKEIPSMPGVYHMSVDVYLRELEEVSKLGIPGVMLFGIPGYKDEAGTGAYHPEGIVQKALQAGKKEFPELMFIADVCLCEYTSHGHCGVVQDGRILNDSSVELVVKTALSLAEAGADMLAPSDMMDGRVGAIRKALDQKGYEEKAVMAYSAKYSSAFYGPFREAAQSKPSFGDRKTYQMDYANRNEAIREVELDIAEGADIVIIKPALAYLDVISEIRRRFDVPVAAYNVSGEYSMLKAAAANGWINEEAAVMEAITSIRRAGAKIIITYHAKDIVRWLDKSGG